ncbi:MAG: hypothetical protein QW205_01640 [Desulfurococcaceae archaeon]
MSSREVYIKAVELISNYQPEDHFKITISRDSIIVSIIDPYLKRTYGDLLELKSPPEYSVSVFFIFMGEHTPVILSKYRLALDKLSKAGFMTTTWIYDCDPETVRFTYMLDHVLELGSILDIDKATEIASLLILINKYAESVKELRKKEHANTGYYEYQFSLEKLSKYMNRLLRLVEKSEVLELLIEIHELPDKYRSKHIGRVFPNSVILYYTDLFSGECPDSTIKALEKVHLGMSSERKAILLVAQPLASILPRSSFKDSIALLNLEA